MVLGMTPKRLLGCIIRSVTGTSELWLEGVRVSRVIDTGSPRYPYYLRVEGYRFTNDLGFEDVATAYRTLLVSSAALNADAPLQDGTFWGCFYAVRFGAVREPQDEERVRNAMDLVERYLGLSRFQRLCDMPVEQMPDAVRRAAAIDTRLIGR
jgi:hypothetical protein